MTIRPGRGDEGQATVELALVLPFVVTLLLLVAQVGLVVRQQLLVVHAAREGARAAVVTSDPGAVRRAVLGSADLDPGRLEVEQRRVGPGADLVEVTVRWRVIGTVPLVGPLVDGRGLTASVVMHVEER